MAAATPVKKLPQMIEWMAQAALLREANTVQKMNGRSVLLSLNKITHYSEKQTTGSGVLKKIYYLYKNVMFQTDPLKSSYSQKQQYPERTLRLKVLRKSSSLAIPKVTLASGNVCNCSPKKFTILNSQTPHCVLKFLKK